MNFDRESEFNRLFERDTGGAGKLREGFTRADAELYFKRLNIIKAAEGWRYMTGITVAQYLENLLNSGFQATFDKFGKVTLTNPELNQQVTFSGKQAKGAIAYNYVKLWMELNDVS